MRKLTIALVVLLAAIAASVSTPAAQSGAKRVASNIAPSCDFSANHYKYAAAIHFEGPNPTFTSYIENQTVTYWLFPNVYDHTIQMTSFSTYASGTSALVDWVQVGTWAGYDAWGNQIVSNYPLGTWTNATHPYDGHAGGSRGTSGNGPVYTPSGSFVNMRYAESTGSTTGYRLSMIGVQPTGSGITTNLVSNGSHVFSIVDQDGHPYGGTGGAGDHITIPPLTYDGVHAGYQQFLGEEIYDNGDGFCGYVEAHSTTFGSNDNTFGAGAFWNAYQGCSGNGWNSDNPASPSCHGGTASVSAPLDMEWTTGPLTLWTYCAEGIGHGPPFIIVGLPVEAVGVATLPPVSQKPQPKVALHAGMARSQLIP